MKISEIMETASAGATSSGNIAAVANPAVAHSKKKAKSVDAMDTEVSLFGGNVVRRNDKTPQAQLKA